MDDIYALLVTLDYPMAYRWLRRTTDSTAGFSKKTRRPSLALRQEA
jgi:hypothetical protein